ncbi:MAG TPA: OmpH family outer membrane protein [Pyrinomonadaceae bacterium]|nr:OmpH family outer membrane protein [Pyrinomonadaceae bacterium]
MRVIRTTIAAALFAAAAATAAVAQAPAAGRPAATPARPAATSPAPQGGSATIAEGKFAIVDTEAFGDPKQGIQKLVAAFQVVEREFKPRRDEIQTLKTRYDGIVKQINDTQKVADQKALAALADQAETLKMEIEQKQQAGQRALDKRVKELTDPVYIDLNNALRSFANARGISVVFDASKMDGVMMIINPNGIDITAAFIAEYNQRNPASTASTTAPREE